MKYVYLITVDDHYDGMEYYLCDTKAAADKLFKKIVKEKYFDPEEDTEEDFEEACNKGFWESKHEDIITYYSWYWESQNTDTVTVLKHQVLTEDEI